jgi:hypothetical protein
MLFFTHIWDFVLKIGTILGITVMPLIVHDHIFGVNADVVIPTIFAGAALSILLYRQAISILASWLYARINLGAPISFTDAKRLRCLFQLHSNLQWFPMKEVRRLPAGQRRAALMDAAEKLQGARRWMIM